MNGEEEGTTDRVNGITCNDIAGIIIELGAIKSTQRMCSLVKVGGIDGV